MCNPLGISRELARQLNGPSTMGQGFKCPNCLAGMHQCFSCKREGRSCAPASPKDAPQEVFQCLVGSCGRFYHPACLNKTPEECLGLIWCVPFTTHMQHASCQPTDVQACKYMQHLPGMPGDKLALWQAPDGCHLCSPLHTCACCSKDSEVGELVPCRRCPVAYHTGACMPPKIADSMPPHPAEYEHHVTRNKPWKPCKQPLWIAERDQQGAHRSKCDCRITAVTTQEPCS